MFFATTRDRQGRKRQHDVGETREIAARLVFKRDPKAQTCSTSRAHRQPDGLLFDTGNAMIWHNRRDFDA